MSVGVQVVIDCADPAQLAEFWAAALGYRIAGTEEPYVVLRPTGDGPELLLQRVPEPKTTKNRMHLDIRTDDLEGEVDRLVSLGALLLNEEPIRDACCQWYVLTDPAGNEFCVCREPVGR